jgi:hypothetical protein
MPAIKRVYAVMFSKFPNLRKFEAVQNISQILRESFMGLSNFAFISYEKRV